MDLVNHFSHRINRLKQLGGARNSVIQPRDTFDLSHHIKSFLKPTEVFLEALLQDTETLKYRRIFARKCILLKDFESALKIELLNSYTQWKEGHSNFCSFSDLCS
jgi:hypothetical protein